jgi:hypothetical protein
MWNLHANELLGAWELGLGRGMSERAAILLRSTAADDRDGRDPARLPLGARDGLLLDLYRAAFGPRLEGMAACPKCGAEQEFELRVEDLKLSAPRDAVDAASWSLAHGVYDVTFRLPDSLDAEAVAAAVGGDPSEGVRLLLERCVIGATAMVEDQRREVAARELPDETVEAISARMGELDPQAEIQLAMECVACRHQWTDLLDVVAFLWGELHAWAMRTLDDVHRLAASYGWSEADILSMSPRRRNLYIEIIMS